MLRGMPLLLLLALFAAPAFAVRADLPPLETVKAVDLERYAGQWFEIARLPNRFQTACASNVVVRYSVEPDGDILVHNACEEADGKLRSALGEARAIDDSGARLEVRFAPKWLGWLPQVWGDYWILELDVEYRWAVVGEPDRKYFWILSRTPTLDPGLIDELIERAEAQGYQLEDLVRTRHDSPVSQNR